MFYKLCVPMLPSWDSNWADWFGKLDFYPLSQVGLFGTYTKYVIFYI